MQKIFNIAIVDDEKSDAEALSDAIGSYAQANGITCNLYFFANGIAFMQSYKMQYDLVFLDIQMPYKDGMSIAQKIREVDECVCLVFVTNMKQYAIKGYEVEATDFILKPIKKSVFEFKFEKILRAVEKTSRIEISIKTKSQIHRVNVYDIDYVEVVNHKCLYHLSDRVIESWETLSNIFEILKDYDFAYCNSCYLVNLKRVTSIDDDVAMVRDTPLKISRAKRKEFLSTLSASLSGGKR